MTLKGAEVSDPAARAAAAAARDEIRAGVPVAHRRHRRGPRRPGVVTRDGERIARRRPVGERAGFEIEVERLAVRHRARALGLHARLVADVEPAFHTGQPVAGHRTEVGVLCSALNVMLVVAPLSRICALFRPQFLERDVVHHQLAVGDGRSARSRRCAPTASGCGHRRSRRRGRGSRPSWTRARTCGRMRGACAAWPATSARGPDREKRRSPRTR